MDGMKLVSIEIIDSVAAEGSSCWKEDGEGIPDEENSRF